ncbi:MAG TPA: DUF3616 domain-containing protein [Candidatus Eisenbacteria bacterium]|nr:DUF3616 domain-containing protein [Candidatus Eisenbacteria bacterium]
MIIRVMLSLAFALAAAAAAQGPEPVTYLGACEPSGAVMLEPGLFIVGDDDTKDLLVYRKCQPSVPPRPLKISGFPGLEKKADLEGAARIGDEIFWIGSHSRKNSGDEDLDRHRLFAIKVTSKGDELAVEAVGKPYKTLLEDLQKDERFERFDLGAATQLAPGKEGALNIEGLAATPDGGLLIGLRNPIRNGKALIIPLSNPRQVMEGAKPSFGDPVELDLGGLGIRSLEHWPAGKSYVIVAGTFADGGSFQLFLWSGLASDKPKPVAGADLSPLVPEAVFFDPAAPAEMFVLSDDGDFCPSAPAFRSRRITLPIGSHEP